MLEICYHSKNLHADGILKLNSNSKLCILPSSTGLDRSRLTPHLLRTSDFCWCDRNAMAQYSLVIKFSIQCISSAFKKCIIIEVKNVVTVAV